VLGLFLAFRPEILRSETPRSEAKSDGLLFRLVRPFRKAIRTELFPTVFPAILILVGVAAVVGYVLD